MEIKYEVIDIQAPKNPIQETEWTWSQVILTDEDMKRQALEECNKRNGY